MAVSVLKANRIVEAGLALLQRETVLPNLVWRDAAGDFAGALNDTISIRVPAYMTARSRTLRAGTTRVRDDLTERKVDVTLTTDVYKDLIITDEALSLDLTNFAGQVLNPAVAGIALKLEDVIAATIVGATYANTVVHDISDAIPYKDLVLAARRKLNDAHVPNNNRVLVVGSALEAEMLGDDKFIRADYMGAGGSAMRDATIGRVGGFDVVTCSAIDPSTAYAFHKSAFVMSQRAPLVPAGAPFGASMNSNGNALRVVRVLDSAAIVDILALDAWVGTNVVTDEGYYDALGMFQPAEGALGAQTTVTSGTATTDVIALTSHGLVAGDVITFPVRGTGGAGIPAALGTGLYPVTINANDFKVALTPGGTPIDITSDFAGTWKFQKNGAAQFVRAVKITSQA